MIIANRLHKSITLINLSCHSRIRMEVMRLTDEIPQLLFDGDHTRIDEILIRLYEMAYTELNPSLNLATMEFNGLYSKVRKSPN